MREPGRQRHRGAPLHAEATEQSESTAAASREVRAAPGSVAEEAAARDGAERVSAELVLGGGGESAARSEAGAGRAAVRLPAGDRREARLVGSARPSQPPQARTGSGVYGRAAGGPSADGSFEEPQRGRLVGLADVSTGSSVEHAARWVPRRHAAAGAVRTERGHVPSSDRLCIAGSLPELQSRRTAAGTQWIQPTSKYLSPDIFEHLLIFPQIGFACPSVARAHPVPSTV